MIKPRHSADGTIGIAILGTGAIAGRSFVPAVRNTPGVRLVGVLSRDRTRARAFADKFGVAHAYDDLGTLLGNPDIHAVIVATPDAQHERQVIAAAESGVHVLCEKPMTSTVDGCRRIHSAVSRAGITFAMGYSLRFLAHLCLIREIVLSGRLGRPRYARALWTSNTASVQETWRVDPAESRHWALGRVGTHLVDFYRWCFGEPTHVSGTVMSPRDGGPNDELSTIVLAYPGMIAELTVSVLFQPGNSLEIHAEEGAITGHDVFNYARSGSPIICNGEPLSYQPNDPFADEVGDFVNAIRTGAPPRSGLEDGLLNLVILEKALAGRR